MPSTNPLRIPVALHSNQSAMTLLHTIPLAVLITRRDRPGKWTTCLPPLIYCPTIKYFVMGVSNTYKSTLCRQKRGLLVQATQPLSLFFFL